MANTAASTIEYRKHRKCFSCHHQAMPMIAISAAKASGLKIDERGGCKGY